MAIDKEYILINNTNMTDKITVTPRQLFEQPEVKERFENILGKKASGFIVSVINCINDNELLQEADKNSILFAAANAAVLDLPINPNLGFAYIIPYNKKQKDGTYKQFAQFQIGYKGIIQLAQRSGQLHKINATAIYDGQLIEENPLDGYKFDFTKKDSNKVIGYACKFILMNGFEKVVYMTVQELKTHGAKYSKTFAKGHGLWETDFEAMALKTIIKLTLSKYAPLSTEMQRAILTDQAVLGDWEGKQLEYVDNEKTKIDPDAQAKVKEETRIKEFIKNCKDVKELEKNCKEYCELLPDDNEIRKLYEEKKMDLTLK